MEYPEFGKTPISDSNPAGSDIIYEPEFEQLQQEIDKLSIATAGGDSVDWEKVVKLSEIILKNKSKNLLVAVYLAQGLIKTKGFHGFISGSIVISDILENFWDTFYPPKKRKKGRINSIRWWYDKADNYIKSLPSDLAIEKEEYDLLKKSLKNIDSIFSKKIDDAPLLRPLIQACERIPVKAFEEAVEEKKTEPLVEKDKIKEAVIHELSETPPRPSPKPVKQVSQQPLEINSLKDANKVLNSGLDTLTKAGNFLFSGDLSNPLSYKIFRLYTWATLDQLPMIEEGRKTVLPPPDPKIKSSLDTMLRGKEYENLIITAEKSLRDHIFWLDLNRYTAMALDELGAKYEKAKIFVESETSLITKKLIDIENLKFSDGTPFADNETKAWLKTISESNEDQGGSISESGDEILLKISEVDKEAKKLLKGKKTFEAITLFEQGLSKAESLREELVFRIFLSRFFIEMGKPQLSFPHLKNIEKKIDEFKLEVWEPKLAVQGLSLIFRVYSQDKDKELKSKSIEIINRISTISPALAFKIQGL